MTTEEFDGLIDRYLSGQALPEEEKLIDDFFNALERKDKIPHYRLSEEMWTAIESNIGARKTGSRVRNRAPVARAKRFSMRKMFAAVVVCAVLAVGFHFYRSASERAAPTLITSTAPKGQKSLITLADGSRIFLNSASSISYPESFDADKREITLTGEAFFEIARDERRPFIVRSAGIVTRVLGTSFNIKSFEGEATTVTVATGRVQVGEASSSEANAHVVLVPGEQAVYQSGTGFVIRKIDPFPAMAWKSHTLYFDNNTLDEVATHLERWYNVRIDFESERVKNCRINGQYKQMDLKSVLESIQYMYPVKYKYSDQNHVELYGKGCDK